MPPPVEFADPMAVPAPPTAAAAAGRAQVDEEVLDSEPLPELEPPEISTRQLAAMTASAMASHPLAGVDVVQGAVQRMIRRATTPQRRTINLAVDFGCELLREATGQVLSEVSGTFGGMPHMPYDALATFLCDALHKWNSRPAIPRFQPPDAEPEVIEVSDSESDISDAVSVVGQADEESIHFGDTDSSEDL